MKKIFILFSLFINTLYAAQAQSLPKPKTPTDLYTFANSVSSPTSEDTKKTKSWSSQTDTWIETDSTYKILKNGWVIIQLKNPKYESTSVCIPKTTVEAVHDWSKNFGLDTENFDRKKPKNQVLVKISDSEIPYHYDFKQDANKKYKYIRQSRGSEGGSVSVRIETDKSKKVCLTTEDDFR
jgi:hypothetical protein